MTETVPHFVKFSTMPAVLLPFVLSKHLKAKDGCRHCHGRGTVGVRFTYDGKGNRITPGVAQICRCMMVDFPAVEAERDRAGMKATEQP